MPLYCRQNTLANSYKRYLWIRSATGSSNWMNKPLLNSIVKIWLELKIIVSILCLERRLWTKNASINCQTMHWVWDSTLPNYPWLSQTKLIAIKSIFKLNRNRIYWEINDILIWELCNSKYKLKNKIKNKIHFNQQRQVTRLIHLKLHI